MNSRVVVELIYPLGAEGFSCLATLHRVPVAGDVIDFGEDWPPSAPQAGASFTVRRVSFNVAGPDDGDPRPPQITLADASGLIKDG